VSTLGRNRVVSGRVRVSLSNFGSGSCRVLVSGQTFPALTAATTSLRLTSPTITSWWLLWSAMASSLAQDRLTHASFDSLLLALVCFFFLFVQHGARCRFAWLVGFGHHYSLSRHLHCSDVVLPLHSVCVCVLCRFQA